MSMTGRYLRVAPEVISRIRATPTDLLEVLYPEPEPTHYAAKQLDIDKTWHVIHFLLNDDPWEGTSPLFEAVLGGEPISDEDLGYGPARYLQPGQVAATAEALQGISPKQLWERYDASRVKRAEIYWSDDPDSKDYALENFEALRQFFRSAAKAKEAVIVWLA